MRPYSSPSSMRRSVVEVLIVPQSLMLLIGLVADPAVTVGAASLPAPML